MIIMKPLCWETNIMIVFDYDGKLTFDYNMIVTGNLHFDRI